MKITWKGTPGPWRIEAPYGYIWAGEPSRGRVVAQPGGEVGPVRSYNSRAMVELPGLVDTLAALLQDYEDLRRLASEDSMKNGWDAYDQDDSAIAATAMLARIDKK